MAKKEQVNSPSHYNSYPMETIDMMLKVFGSEKVSAFCLLNAFKYRMRAGVKHADTDIDFKKEQWYLNKYQELQNKVKNANKS